MTTTLRIQPLRASTSAMAAENLRLSQERARIERELAELSTGLPPGAAEVVRQADELMAEHGRKLAELKAKRDAIDAKFGVSAREQTAAQAAARREHYAALVTKLRQAEDARCAAVEQIEVHARGLRDAITEAFAEADRVRASAKELAAFGGVVRPSFGTLAQTDFAARTGGRIAGLMATLPALYQRKLGCINFGAEGSFYPPEKEGWAKIERERFEPDLETAIAWGAHDAE